jgi:DNA-3-methyladenine glycosylase II
MTPDYWQQACKDLSRADPIMRKLIKQYKGESLKARGNAFYTLARSIVGQQISVKAADSVWTKLESKLTEVNPACVLSADPGLLRSAGLSSQKVVYLLEIARFFEKNNHDPNWETTNEKLARQLTSIKGVGRWTAEMFMIFHLLKPDVLPLGDLGLLKGIYLHYNQGEYMPKSDIIEIARAWQPWRTVATWHLWRALDPVPVEY